MPMVINDSWMVPSDSTRSDSQPVSSGFHLHPEGANQSCCYWSYKRNLKQNDLSKSTSESYPRISALKIHLHCFPVCMDK